MSAGLEFLPRGLAPEGSLAGDLLRGAGPVRFPAPGAGDARIGTPGRLSPDAFGTTSPAVRERLEDVLRGDGLVVTTGQQPVLFLGPLYVVYKALTAIELAKRLEERLEVPVVPVFWIASDDHDWQEIGQCTLLSPEGRLETLRLRTPDGFESRSAGPAPIGADIASLIDEMSELVPASEFAPVYLELVREAYAPGRTVAGAFAATLAGLLDEGAGYAWLDASAAPLKEAAAPFFEGLLGDPEGVLDAERRGAASLRAAGSEPPIAEIPEALPLFWDGGEGRQRVVRAEGGFAAGADGPVADVGEWRRRLAEAPGGFSPNVSSRPVLESWLMPVAATILGPGEIAYWSQLVPLFETLGVPFPAVQPRGSWLVLEPRVRGTLEGYGLEPGDLSDHGDAAIARLTEESRPPELDAALGGLRAAIGSGLAPVDEAIRESFPGLRSSVGKARKALFDAVAELAGAVDQEARRSQETDVARIRRTAEQLFPSRRPQERVLSPFYFLARYGDAFLESARAATSSWLSGFLAEPTGEG